MEKEEEKKKKKELKGAQYLGHKSTSEKKKRLHLVPLKHRSLSETTNNIT